MKKAIIYARYSSEMQTEQSIEGQLRVCNKFAEDNGFTIIETYIDRATTGTNDQRPAFQQMLRDSKKGEWQYVLVYKGDRFARNRIESAINKKTLKDNGVKLVSCTENIPDTPEGIILESLLEGMAEYYSAELSQKVKRGKNETRHKELYIGGHVLFGYHIVDKKYTIHPENAEIVKQIFADYINGKTVKAIWEDLNARGIKNNEGKPFSKNTIHYMLQKEQYIGIFRHGEDVFYKTFPRIIDQGTWEQAQKIINENKHAPSRRKSYGKYLLSGKMFCGTCGSLMTGESGKARNGTIHYYYKCCHKKKNARNCEMRQVKKDLIERKVFEICCQALHSSYLPMVIEQAYQIHVDELQSNITVINLTSQLTEKEKALNNILTAIEQGIFTDSTKQRLLDLENEIATIRYQITQATEKIKPLEKSDYEKFFADLLAQQEVNGNFMENIFDMMVREVLVFQDKIRVTFNFSPDNQPKKQRTYKFSAEELAEAQAEYGSNLDQLTQVSGSNPNQSRYFIRKDYWGLWIYF